MSPQNIDRANYQLPSPNHQSMTEFTNDQISQKLQEFGHSVIDELLAHWDLVIGHFRKLAGATIATASALERQVRFLSEKRTEAYLGYAAGASEEKIVHGAKRSAGHPALLDGRLTVAEAAEAIA